MMSARIIPFFLLLVFLVGCAKGHWIKEGVGPEETERAYEECETLGSLRLPPPATLADKVGGNPDMSDSNISKCMNQKGYQWVIDDDSREKARDNQ